MEDIQVSKTRRISEAELVRDAALYRRLMRRISFSQKAALADCRYNYRSYQAILFALAEAKGIKILPLEK